MARAVAHLLGDVPMSRHRGRDLRRARQAKEAERMAMLMERRSGDAPPEPAPGPHDDDD